MYLTPRERDRLQRLSRELGRSQAEIIREAILQYEPGPPADRNFAVFNSGVGDGRSVADIPEEELLEGFGE